MGYIFQKRIFKSHGFGTIDNPINVPWQHAVVVRFSDWHIWRLALRQMALWVSGRAAFVHVSQSETFAFVRYQFLQSYPHRLRMSTWMQSRTAGRLYVPTHDVSPCLLFQGSRRHVLRGGSVSGHSEFPVRLPSQPPQDEIHLRNVPPQQ